MPCMDLPVQLATGGEVGYIPVGESGQLASWVLGQGM